MKSNNSTTHLVPLEAPTKGDSVATYKEYLECYTIYVQAVERRREDAAIRRDELNKARPAKPANPPKVQQKQPVDPIVKAAVKRGKNRKKRLRRKIKKAHQKAELTSVQAKVATNLAVIAMKVKKVAPKKAKKSPAEAPAVTMPPRQTGRKGTQPAAQPVFTVPTPVVQQTSTTNTLRDIALVAERVSPVSAPPVAAPPLERPSVKAKAPEVPARRAAETVPPQGSGSQFSVASSSSAGPSRPRPAPVFAKPSPLVDVRSFPDPEKTTYWYEKHTGRMISVDEFQMKEDYKSSGNGIVHKVSGAKYYESHDKAIVPNFASVFRGSK